MAQVVEVEMDETEGAFDDLINDDTFKRLSGDIARKDEEDDSSKTDQTSSDTETADKDDDEEDRKKEEEDNKKEKEEESEEQTITPLEDDAIRQEEDEEQEDKKKLQEQNKPVESQTEESTPGEETATPTGESTNETPQGTTPGNDTPQGTETATPTGEQQQEKFKPTNISNRRVWDPEEKEKEEDDGLTQEEQDKAHEMDKTWLGKGEGALRYGAETLTDAAIGLADKGIDKVETGVHKVYEKVRTPLFKATRGVIKGAKATKKFFKKTLPGAIKSGAGFLGGLLKKTKLGKYVADKWEAGRPAREAKAAKKAAEKAAKRAEWLKQKDAKRVADEEKKRLKEEQKAEKKRLKEEKEKTEGPGAIKRFARWVSSGAKKLVKKIAESPVGKFTGKTIDRVKNSAFVAWAKREVNGIARDVKYVKKWIGKQKDKLSDFATQVRDDFDQFDFEEHIEEQSKNDTDYWNRYNACVDELKARLEPMRGTVTSEDISKAVKDLEKDKEDPSLLQKFGKGIGGAKDMGETVFENGQKVLNMFGDKSGAKALEGLGKKAFPPIGALKDGVNMVDKVMKTVDNADKSKMFEIAREIAENEGDTELEDANFYASSTAKINAVKSGFGAVENLTSGSGKIAGMVPGGKPIKEGLKFAGKVVSTVGDLVTYDMKDDETKLGFKKILGGPEGYKAVKQKYKLKARAMRAAICDALGVMYMDDAVNAHKWNLSEKMAQRAQSSDESKSKQAKLMAERGGLKDTKTKDFAKLMGAGKFVKSTGRRQRRAPAQASA